MKRKNVRIYSLILALVLILAAAAGCSSSGAGNKAGNTFDYGITVNVPDSWDSGIYKLTAEENPKHPWDETEYPMLYGVRCDYTGNGEEQVLCSLYVFNAVDWNELSLGWGDGPPFGEQIKKDDKFAYVVSGWPQDSYYEPGTDDYNKFSSMIEYITDNDGHYVFDKLFTIGATDRQPTVAESRNKTVERDCFYFIINIPTTWQYDDLDIDYEYESDLWGYETKYMTRYALKTGTDEPAEMFSAYVFDNSVWEKIEAETEGPPIATKIASDDEYTLAVVLPQDNPLGNDGELAKTFDRMQNDIRDFDAFFKLS